MMHNDWAQLGLVPPSSAQSTLLVIKCSNVESISGGFRLSGGTWVPRSIPDCGIVALA